MNLYLTDPVIIVEDNASEMYNKSYYLQRKITNYNLSTKARKIILKIEQKIYLEQILNVKVSKIHKRNRLQHFEVFCEIDNHEV